MSVKSKVAGTHERIVTDPFATDVFLSENEAKALLSGELPTKVRDALARSGGAMVDVYARNEAQAWTRIYRALPSEQSELPPEVPC